MLFWTAFILLSFSCLTFAPSATGIESRPVQAVSEKAAEKRSGSVIGEVVDFNSKFIKPADRQLCLTFFHGGRCKVENCSYSRRGQIGIIAESGTRVSTYPSNGVTYTCDGFVFKGSCSSQWYKVGDHCKTTYDCSTNRFSYCCRAINILTHGKPGWEPKNTHNYVCPYGW